MARTPWDHSLLEVQGHASMRAYTKFTYSP